MRGVQDQSTRIVDAEYNKKTTKRLEETLGVLVEYVIALANDQIKLTDYAEALSARLEPLVSEKDRVTINEWLNDAIDGVPRRGEKVHADADRDYVLRLAAHAVDGDHLIPDSLNIVVGAKKIAKALARYAELLLHAALDGNVDGCLLFLELFAKGRNLHEVIGGWRAYSLS